MTKTRNSFLLWVLNFINWLSSYRLTLDESLRNKKAVLILDGHNSRQNPIALKALRNNNIEVIILPVHTTHLLQMFDVVLSRPFKKNFAKKLTKIFEKECLQTKDKSMMFIIRECVIEALIKSWSDTCTVENYLTAARITGSFPTNYDAIKNSPFIHDLSNEEKELARKKRNNIRLNINGRHLTDPIVLEEINNVIYQMVEFRYLCIDGDFDYLELCKSFPQHESNDVPLFSPIHYFAQSTNAPVFF